MSSDNSECAETNDSNNKFEVNDFDLNEDFSDLLKNLFRFGLVYKSNFVLVCIKHVIQRSI